MKQIKVPPRAPYPPHKPERSHYNTQGATNYKVVYRDVELVGDNDMDLEEYFKDMDEELPKPEKNFNQITLQDIIDLAPVGAKLSDINLHISYPRMVDYLDVKFIYQERDLAEEERAYQAAMDKYNKDYLEYEMKMEVYKSELVAFEEWRRAEKVKELEAQLATLKK